MHGQDGGFRHSVRRSVENTPGTASVLSPQTHDLLPDDWFTVLREESGDPGDQDTRKQKDKKDFTYKNLLF